MILAPRKQQVLIVTLGRHALANIYRDSSCVQKLAMARDFDSQNVREALLEAVLPADSLVFCFNAKQFVTPESQRGAKSWRHSGLHWENAQAILDHNGGKTMGKLASDISTRLEENREAPKIHLALCCNQGWDRSVGVSVVLENALKIAGFVVSTRHLCQQAWRSNLGCQKEAKFVSNSRHPNKPCPECQVWCSRDLVLNAIKNEWIPELSFSHG